MPTFSLDLRFDQIRTLAFGAIGLTYTQIGSALSNPTRLVILQNNTNQELMFTFDMNGAIDHIALPATGQIIMDCTTNRVADSSGFFFSTGTRIGVRHLGVAPTSGNVYVSAAHGRGD